MVSTIKRIFMVFFCVLVVLTSFIFSVSAESVYTTYYFNAPDPAVNFDGYIIVPHKRLSDGAIPANLYFWEIVPDTTVDVDTLLLNGDIQVNVHIDSDKLYFDFISSVEGLGFTVSIYRVLNGENNDVYPQSTNYVNNDNPLSFFFSGVQYYKCPNMFSGVTRITHTNFDGYYGFSYNAVYADSNPQFEELRKVNQHFTDMLLKQDFTNEQLTTLLEQFNSLLEYTASTNDMLGEFIYYYWENFVTLDFPQYISSINARIDNIYRLLNKQGDVEQTTVDTSKLDEFADVEQSLLNNDEANSAIGDMNVSIDGQAYSFIWDLVTRILNSHPEVFGLIITVLTLGFLALILNR